MASITLTVNGATRTVDVAEDTPLLYVLRNQLELSGPRLGCEMAQCGACAVLADGEEIRSCVTRAANVTGRSIVTIEGLAAVWADKKGLDAPQAAAALHPIQQAWIDLQVPQCGYCQSGMMIAAADLLERNPDADRSRYSRGVQQHAAVAAPVPLRHVRGDHRGRATRWPRDGGLRRRRR